MVTSLTAEQLPVNDLPEIGCYVMGKGFWDRQGANTAILWKEMYSRSCVFIKRSDVGQRITHFRRDFVKHGGD